MFDVLAKLPVNYMRAPFNTPEREMALELIQELGPEDLLVLDRGYPGYEMFHAIVNKGVDFLIRIPKDGMFKPAQEFLARGKRDGKITLHPPKALVKANPEADYQPLTLRIVVVTLPGSQEAAVFITTLLERPKYPPGAFRSCLDSCGQVSGPIIYGPNPGTMPRPVPTLSRRNILENLSSPTRPEIPPAVKKPTWQIGQ